jgi:hypothetical protein
MDNTEIDVAVIRSQFAELNRQYNDPRNYGRKQYDILLSMKRLNAAYHRRTGKWLEVENPQRAIS